MRPERLPGMLLLIVGFIVARYRHSEFDTLHHLSLTWKSTMSHVNANTVAIWAGGAIALIGILVLAIVRERYAVRIATAEGEKNAVVSERKEYISQIVNALNEAFSRHNIQSVSEQNLA